MSALISKKFVFKKGTDMIIIYITQNNNNIKNFSSWKNTKMLVGCLSIGFFMRNQQRIQLISDLKNHSSELVITN